jgi:hypothetical protein
VLLDANFSTLWCEGSEWSPEAVFGVLNSTWGELCMEALGATLGGGALKLEAAHLRQLPLPTFSGAQKEKIRDLVRKAFDAGAFERYRPKIDQVIVSALAQRELSSAEAMASLQKLAEITLALRAKRRRKPGGQSQGTK